MKIVLLLLIVSSILCIPTNFLQQEKTELNQNVEIQTNEDGDAMIKELSSKEQQLEDETPLNSAQFEQDDTQELIEDASKMIVDDIQLIGQNTNLDFKADENHQIIDASQNLINENDSNDINDEIQQEIIIQEQFQSKDNSQDISQETINIV